MFRLMKIMPRGTREKMLRTKFVYKMIRYHRTELSKTEGEMKLNNYQLPELSGQCVFISSRVYVDTGLSAVVVKTNIRSTAKFLGLGAVPEKKAAKEGKRVQMALIPLCAKTVFQS